MATLEFLGAAGTVTGSKHLVEAVGQRLLVDCGLYQGLKALRLRNWERLPVDPDSIDWVVLTHGHIDHTEFLPRLIKDSFKGRVLATRAAADLLKLLLPDSGHLQEEEAVYHKKRGTSKHPEEFEGDMRAMVMNRNCPLECADVRLARTPDESRAINAVQGPVLIISASGMVSGGRVLHHQKHRLRDPRTTVLLLGYQALGTRGRQLQEGASSLSIYGEEIPVRAHVEAAHGLSAHADADGLLRWLRTASRHPRRAFVVHGEPGPARALATSIEKELGWAVTVPGYRDRVPIE